MGKNLRIITLIEDTSFSDGLLAEHGLSFFIEYGDKRILFDTGQSDMLVQNAETLDINLAEVDAIILSHGHYDHTGGLPAVLDIACKATVYLHPAAIEPKYNRKASGVKSIGMPRLSKKAIQGRQVVWTVTPAQIFSGMSVTGQVPRLNNFEDVGGDFFLDKSCRKNDELWDDQALIIESQKGLVIILGCAHAGVVNTLHRIADIIKKKQFFLVMGGMHLLNASKERIEKTISVLKEYNVQKIGAAHCTGTRAANMFSASFQDRCFSCFVGTQLSFEESLIYFCNKTTSKAF